MPSFGADLAKRFGESPEIVHAIEAHHEDVEPQPACRRCSSRRPTPFLPARPGARKETLDAYMKRLEKMEEIANSHEGERTFAIQAGREVRVMVKPDVVGLRRVRRAGP